MTPLLNEKYRPKLIKDYVFQSESIRERVMKWISSKEIPNILLSGPPGCGKTTLSRIIPTELGIDRGDILHVNASLGANIEFVRDLDEWLKKKSFSPFKIVRLEECDKLSMQVSFALREVMEFYSERARFIATCNYVGRVERALISRFQQVKMEEFDQEQILERVVSIIESEGIEVIDPDDLMKIIETHGSDLRKIINTIEECTSKDKRLLPPEKGQKATDEDSWYELWTNNESPLDSAMELSGNIDESNVDYFYQVMYDNHQKFPDPTKAVILLSKFLDRAKRCSNQKLHLEAFLYSIKLHEGGD